MAIGDSRPVNEGDFKKAKCAATGCTNPEYDVPREWPDSVKTYCGRECAKKSGVVEMFEVTDEDLKRGQVIDLE